MECFGAPLAARLLMTHDSIDNSPDGLTIAVQGTRAALARVAVPWTYS
jgi:hypothetical protein